MAETVQKTVTTFNKKVPQALGDPDWQYVDPRLPDDFEMPKEKNVAVAVNVPIPETAEEAAGDGFYGSEKSMMDAVQDDCARIRTNSARPLLREAEDPDFDFPGMAQEAVDSYRPGRRGGFTARISEEEAEQIDDVEELRALLRRRGIVGRGGAAA